MPVSPLSINALPTQSNADLVLRMTEAHRAYRAAAPAAREAAFLEVQFPSILQPIRADDLFAGRRAYPPVCFDPDMMGGFAYNEAAFTEMLADLDEEDPNHSKLESAQAYWREANSPRKTRECFPATVQEALPEDGHLKAERAAYPLYRQAGTTVDYALLCSSGLPGLQARIEDCSRRNPEATAYYTGTLQALKILSHCLAHYSDEAHRGLAEGNKNPHLPAIAAACDALQYRAPQSIYEALQLIWLYSLVSSTQNFGRLDSALAPVFSMQQEAKIEDVDPLEAFCGFWRMADEELNLMNARVIIGGEGRPDPDTADQLAILMIEAARRTRVTRPQLTLRWWLELSEDVWEAALTCIAEGTTFPILYSDPTNIAGVAQAYGVDQETACEYVPYGCGEYVLGARTLSSPNGIINLLKCFELALFNGVDPKSGRQMGLATGSDFNDFESLWAAYAAQVEYLTEALALAHRSQHETNAGDFAMLLTSLLMDGSLEKGRSILDGGTELRGGILESYGNTNAAESLNAIKKVVFEQRACSLDEVRNAMGANFEGHEAMLQAFRTVPKYGNNLPEADDMAVRVHEHICAACKTAGQQAGLDYYLPVMINNWNNTVQGHACLASVDGRRIDAPLVSGNGALPGGDQQGPTALLLSLAKLPCHQHAGAVQNIKFDSGMFRRHKQKLKALLETYFLNGGTQAMLTVVARGDLLEAMEHPEKHPNLLVRIGGFSARFVSLPREVQLEVIDRTGHG